ncbi:MAG TPA: inositol monophosphatase family protein, partial [Pseudomonadales bacterium]|nr:inositol monophosphatase family protein [Pseudomonadales bacterium]
SKGNGAYKAVQGQAQPISVRPLQAPMKIVASRRHGGEQLGHLLKKIEARFGEYETTNLGSSLKICILAEGGADLYPRLAPTSEWDTGAAAAVLRAAGGEILDGNYLPMRYNESESIITPVFIAVADKTQEWGEILL